MLLARAQQGDRHAREEFVKANTGLAVTISQRYHTLDAEDAFQMAMVGLVKAMDTFDPSRGFAFSTYASRCMKNELNREITMALAQSRGEGVIPASLDRALSADNEEATLGGLLGDTDPDMEAFLLHDEVRAALGKLYGRHKEIVERVYGLNGRDEETMTAIAADMGVSKARVAQLHAVALERMRGNPSPLRHRDRRRRRESPKT